MEKKKIKLWKKILWGIAVLIIILFITVISYKIYVHVDMDIRFKEFEKREAIETKGTLSYVEEDNYAKVEDTDYITQDGVGVKVDTISITDDTFNANINFKLDKAFDYQTLGYGYAIYDENKNIYEIFSRMHLGENEKYDYNSIFLQRELGIYNKVDIYSSYLADRSGINIESINENEKTVVNKITIEAKDKFPQSKKIYIKLFDVGYFNMNKDENGETTAQNINLTDAKWQFEFDIPEEMNKRYQETGGGTTGNFGYKVSFDATKKDLSKKLFINFKVGDNQYKSELIEE